MTDKNIRKIAQSRFVSAEYERQLWVIKAESGTTIEDVTTEPSYFAHISQFLKTGHEIIVRDDEGKFRLHLFVRACGQGWASVALLSKHEWNVGKAIDRVAVPKTAEYEVTYRGAALWSVLRNHDRHIMVERLPTRDAAAQWLTDHLASVAKATT